MGNFEKELLKKFEKDHPPVFEMALYLLDKMNAFNKSVKILINVLLLFLFPIYLVIFQFIFKK